MNAVLLRLAHMEFFFLEFNISIIYRPCTTGIVLGVILHGYYDVFAWIRTAPVGPTSPGTSWSRSYTTSCVQAPSIAYHQAPWIQAASERPEPEIQDLVVRIFKISNFRIPSPSRIGCVPARP